MAHRPADGVCTYDMSFYYYKTTTLPQKGVFSNRGLNQNDRI
jgi:hypothetical protein